WRRLHQRCTDAYRPEQSTFWGCGQFWNWQLPRSLWICCIFPSKTYRRKGDLGGTQPEIPALRHQQALMDEAHLETVNNFNQNIRINQSVVSCDTFKQTFALQLLLTSLFSCPF